MKDAALAMLSSRKFWAGFLTIAAIVAAEVLVKLGKMGPGEVGTFVAGVSAVGASYILGTAHEDAMEKRAAGAAVESPSATASVTIPAPAPAVDAAPPTPKEGSAS
jgi:hypothetical protein